VLLAARLDLIKEPDDVIDSDLAFGDRVAQPFAQLELAQSAEGDFLRAYEVLDEVFAQRQDVGYELVDVSLGKARLRCSCVLLR
jgi:hypothetical protein